MYIIIIILIFPDHLKKFWGFAIMTSLKYQLNQIFYEKPSSKDDDGEFLL